MIQNIKICFFNGFLLFIIYFIQPLPVLAQDQNPIDLDSIQIQLDSGRQHFYIGNYESALRNYYNVISMAERFDDKQSMAKAYNNIGAVYSNIREHDLALKYLELSMNLKEELGDQDGAASTMVNIAGIYQDLNDEEKALEYYNASLSLKKESNDSLAIAAILNNLGIIYFKNKTYDLATEYFEQSLLISESLHDDWSLANTLNNLSETYLVIGQYAKALILLDESQSFIKKTGGLALEEENLDIRMKTLAKMEKFEEAFSLQDRYMMIKDSIINSEKIQNIAELEAKYESEKKERENKLLKTEMAANKAIIERQRIVFFASAAVILILLIFMITLIRYNRLRKRAGQLLRKQKNKIEKQNNTLEKLNQELGQQNTEIKNQKTELEDLIKVKDKLFSILSHDLRSPLNSLSGLLKLIKKGLLNREEEQKYLGELDTKIGYTQHFLENMLQWSRSQLDGFTISIKTFDIKEMIEEVCNNYDLQAREKKIVLENAANQSISVSADQNLTKIALGNLISNAIKFSSSNDTIKVNSELIGKKCKISIQDHGIGMNRDTVEKILAGEKSQTTRGTSDEIGSGLGLIIAKDFIEKNKGFILIDSMEGKGSTFSFTIPIK